MVWLMATEVAMETAFSVKAVNISDSSTEDNMVKDPFFFIAQYSATDTMTASAYDTRTNIQDRIGEEDWGSVDRVI